jgi:zinc transporter ZupT
MVIAYPISYFFIRQGFTQKVLKAKINSIAAGMVFLFVATSSIQNALFTDGGDTKQTAITNTILFLLFQVVSTSFTIRKYLTKRS